MRTAILLSALLLGMSIEHLAGTDMDVSTGTSRFVGTFFVLFAIMDVVELMIRGVK